MRRLKRNQREFIYETIKGTQQRTDTQGYKTAIHDVEYNEAVTAKGCVVFKGTSSHKPYGIEEDWSVQIIPNAPLTITVGTRITIDGKYYYVLSHPTTMNEQRIFCK